MFRLKTVSSSLIPRPTVDFDLLRVSMRYGEVEGLAPISLHVQTGERVAVMGRSGSGKSTLLRILAGLLLPTGGDCHIDGRDLRTYRAADLSHHRTMRIGLVFQDYWLIPYLTVYENVRLAEALSKSRGRSSDTIRAVGLESRSGHLPGQLSGGERQRAAIARALVGQPAAILADEPTGALDAETGRETMGFLLDLVTERRLTLVCATHDLAAAQTCDRVVHLPSGPPAGQASR